MVPRVRECPLALARRGLKLLLPHLERLRAHVVLDPDLLQSLARRVVVILGSQCGEREGSLPDRLHGLDNFRGEPGEGGRITLGANSNIAPEPLQTRRDRGRRAAPQGLADGFDGGAAPGGEDVQGRAFDVGVRDVRASLTGGAVRWGVTPYVDIISIITLYLHHIIQTIRDIIRIIW